jgi:hypothetical protein
MCTVLLPPGVNPIAIHKCIIYHILFVEDVVGDCLRTECREHSGLKETNCNMENDAKGESL